MFHVEYSVVALFEENVLEFRFMNLSVEVFNFEEFLILRDQKTVTWLIF